MNVGSCPDNPAKPKLRAASMIIVTWIALIMCAGGEKAGLQAGVPGLFIAAIVTALPAVIVVLLLQFVEGLIGKNGEYITSSLGLLPLALIVLFGGSGDHSYMVTIVLSGLIWSSAWIGTSLLFLRRG